MNAPAFAVRDGAFERQNNLGYGIFTHNVDQTWYAQFLRGQ